MADNKKIKKEKQEKTKKSTLHQKNTVITFMIVVSCFLLVGLGFMLGYFTGQRKMWHKLAEPPFAMQSNQGLPPFKPHDIKARLNQKGATGSITTIKQENGQTTLQLQDLKENILWTVTVDDSTVIRERWQAKTRDELEENQAVVVQGEVDVEAQTIKAVRINILPQFGADL